MSNPLVRTPFAFIGTNSVAALEKILRLHYRKLLREPHVRSRHFTKSLSEVGNDFGSGSFPFGNQAGLFFGGCHRISLCLDVVADRPSPLKTSRDLRSAAGRCEPAHRDLTFAIAEVWSSLARQQEAMAELLAIWTEAHSGKQSELLEVVANVDDARLPEVARACVAGLRAQRS
jgi:hypothetical protein